MAGKPEQESTPLLNPLNPTPSPVTTYTSLPLTPKSTPLPKLKLMLVCMVQFCEAFSANSLFAYIAFMVLSFGITHNTSDVGFYSGFIASSFFFTQFLTSFFWGRLSDTYGRRRIIMFGLTGNIISCTIFGFSKNLAMAMAARCLNGLMNGNLPVAKTYLGEVTDKSNQAQAFSWFAVSWGCGVILGPLGGGLLSMPTTQYSWWPHWLAYDFLHEFAFFLPNLCTVVFSFITLMLCFFYLEETVTPGTKKQARNFKQSFVEIFSDKVAMYCCIIYSIMCFAAVIFTEVLPLYAITSPLHGGLDFSAHDNGLVLGVAGAFAVSVQAFGFKPLARMIPFKKIFFTAQSLMAVMIVSLVEVHGLLRGSDYTKTPGFWFAICAIMCFNQTFMQSTFSAINIMMNNSVPFQKMGAMNGVAMSLAALGRAIGPTVGANLFAGTTGIHHTFLISFRTSFYLVAVLYISNSIFAFFKLPTRVNTPYVAAVVVEKSEKSVNEV